MQADRFFPQARRLLERLLWGADGKPAEPRRAWRIVAIQMAVKHVNSGI